MFRNLFHTKGVERRLGLHIITLLFWHRKVRKGDRKEFLFSRVDEKCTVERTRPKKNGTFEDRRVWRV